MDRARCCPAPATQRSRWPPAGRDGDDTSELADAADAADTENTANLTPPSPNTGEQVGIGLYQTTQKDGMRCSAAAGYLRPAADRRNLVVRTGVQVSRLVIQSDRCTGVEYLGSGDRQRAMARREVVVCAGAYNSPQLLMLSGIGPPEHLAAHGIEVARPLPDVGENLGDHLFV